MNSSFQFSDRKKDMTSTKRPHFLEINQFPTQFVLPLYGNLNRNLVQNIGCTAELSALSKLCKGILTFQSRNAIKSLLEV